MIKVEVNIKKDFHSTDCQKKKIEHKPTASTQTALHWAPLKSSVDLDNSSKLTSGDTFIFREWICMIRALASSFGWGNSILRSNRPDRNKAGSRISTRLVAAITCNKKQHNSHLTRRSTRQIFISFKDIFADFQNLSSLHERNRFFSMRSKFQHQIENLLLDD